ncbi:uncharacterized protein [Dermacentor albipictus]|uniref:uncharacterized protein n=1 Tax=Dermacentor albipictus TaxID=60249 RepID=UPI0038FCF30E
MRSATLIFVSRAKQQILCRDPVKINKNQAFTFDQLFEEAKGNVHVFQNTTNNMLKTLLGGCNCYVFRHIATAAGKMFSIVGCEECPGVVSLPTSVLYHRVHNLRSDGQTCNIAVTYQFYTEVVKDMLCPNGPSFAVWGDQHKLTTSYHPQTNGITKHLNRTLTNMLSVYVSSDHRDWDLALPYVTFAYNSSRQDTAGFKGASSYERTERALDHRPGYTPHSQLRLPLCSSPSARRVVYQDLPVPPGPRKLNRHSLVVSKDRIWRLPYRGSELAHNFKDSLSGSCRAVMIAAVTPSKLSYIEACNSLKYAEWAMKIKLQPRKNTLNVNVHISVYSALSEEYKEEAGCLHRKLEKAEAENTTLEAEVGDSKLGLALTTASRSGLLRVRETACGDSGQARCNNVMPKTPFLSPSADMGSPYYDGRMVYYVDAAQNIYRVRSKITGQIWGNETVFNPSLPKENCKQQVINTVKLQPGCTEAIGKLQLAGQRVAKEKLEALDNERRLNCESSKGPLAEASVAASLEPVQTVTAPMGPLVKQVNTEGKQQMLGQLPVFLRQKCNPSEGLSNLGFPHLRCLYVILEMRNCWSTYPCDANAAIAKKANGPVGTWAGETETVVDGPLDLASLLQAPDWHLPTTVRRKSAVLPPGHRGDSFKDYIDEATFVRFPNWFPHPHRHRRNGIAGMVVASATPIVPSWSPKQANTANETFVSDTPRLPVLEPMSSLQPSTPKV